MYRTRKTKAAHTTITDQSPVGHVNPVALAQFVAAPGEVWTGHRANGAGAEAAALFN